MLRVMVFNGLERGRFVTWEVPKEGRGDSAIMRDGGPCSVVKFGRSVGDVSGDVR